MASKSGQEATSTEQIEELLETVDKTLDRLKTLYEQYFLGIQKQAPAYLHSDVERKLRELTQLNIRNTGLRYRLATLQQKFGSYNSYWRRTLRQIENGTYLRNLAKIGREAARNGTDIPEEILAAMPKRMREQVLRDRDKAIATAKRRKQLEDEALLALADDEAKKPAKTPTGAHIIEDEDIDYNALFSAFEDDAPKLETAVTQPIRKRSTRPPVPHAPEGVRPTGTTRPPATHATGPTQPIRREAAQPSRRTGPVPVEQVRRATGPVPAVTESGSGPLPPTQPIARAPDAQRNHPDSTQPTQAIRRPPVPRAPTAPPTGPTQAMPRAPTVPGAPPPIPRAPTAPPGGPTQAMPRAPTAQPTAPAQAKPRAPTARPDGSTRAMPRVPATQAIPRPAPSQQSRPIPVMPGSAAQTGPVPVESMSGPFPRAATERPAAPKPAHRATQSIPRPPLKPPPGMSEADVNALHAKYVQAKRMVGEKVDPGSREKLLKTLHQTAPKIMEQYKASGVDFSVVVKNNQVVLKAKPKT